MRACSATTPLMATTPATEAPAGPITLPRSGARLAAILINMDKAADRRAVMAERLAALDLPFMRLSGVDGRALTFPHPDFSERAFRWLHGRRTSPPEVGCYLSHVAAARTFLDSPADLALVIEDDVIFEDDLIAALDAAALAGGWNLLRLSTVNRGRKYRVADLGGRRHLAITLTREKGAGAYVIDRAAAHWITTRLLPMRLSWDIAFDLEFLAGLRACFINPPPARQNVGAPTQIQHLLPAIKIGGITNLTVLPYRAGLEIARVAMRGARLLAASARGSSGRPRY